MPIQQKLMILAELSDYQKKTVDTWKKGDYSFSDHVFGKSDRLEIPLIVGEDTSRPPSELENLLSQHNIRISNYKEGKAKDKYGREVNIGKILNKIKAPPDIIKSFVEDKSRQASKSKNLKIIVSRNPYDVAGMSTNRGWTSCMNMEVGKYRNKLINMEVGKYRNKLNDDLEEGTHVAYLVNSDDTDIKHPIARIALKPFISMDNEKDRIISPEPRQYGTSDDKFADSVRAWTENNFSPKSGLIYKKSDKVYDDNNDSKNRYIFKKDEKTLNKAAKSSIRGVKIIAAEHGNEKIRNKLVNDEYYSVRQAVAQYGNNAQRNILVNDEDYSVRQAVAQYGNDAQKNILVNDKNYSVRQAVAQYGNDAQKNILVNDKNYSVRQIVAQYGNDAQKNILVNDENYSVRQIVAKYGNDAQKNILVNDENYYVRQAVAEYGNDAQRNKLINDEDYSVRQAVAKYGNDSQRNKLVNDEDYEVRQIVAKYGNDAQRNKLVNDKNYSVRQAVAQYGNDAQKNILVNDENYFVRQAVAKYGNHKHWHHIIENKKENKEIRNIAEEKLKEWWVEMNKKQQTEYIKEHPATHLKVTATK